MGPHLRRIATLLAAVAAAWVLTFGAPWPAAASPLDRVGLVETAQTTGGSFGGSAWGSGSSSSGSSSSGSSSSGSSWGGSSSGGSSSRGSGDSGSAFDFIMLLVNLVRLLVWAFSVNVYFGLAVTVVLLGFGVFALLSTRR